MENYDVQVEYNVHELAVAAYHLHSFLLNVLFICITWFRALLSQECVNLGVFVLSKLLNNGYLLVAKHDPLAYLLSHLHGTSTRLFLLFFTLLLFLPAGLDSADHVLVVVDLALDGLPQHSLVVVHHLIQLLSILVSSHCLLEVIFEFKLVESIGVKVIGIEFVEPGAGDLTVVDDSGSVDNIRIVELGRGHLGVRLHGVVHVQTCKLGAQGVRQLKGVVRAVICCKGVRGTTHRVWLLRLVLLLVMHWLLIELLGLLVEGLGIHFGLDRYLFKRAVGTESLRHASLALGLTRIQLLIFHLRGFSIVLTGLHSKVLGLHYLSLRFHFFLFCNSLLWRQMLELILLVAMGLLHLQLLVVILLLLRNLPWQRRLRLEGRIILNVDSV